MGSGYALSTPPARWLGWVVCWAFALGLLPSQEQPVLLAGPLSTQLELPGSCRGPRQVDIVLSVPQGAPADLGLGVYVQDREGRWFQRNVPGPLPSGARQHLSVRLAPGEEAPLAQPGLQIWTADWAEACDRTGLVLWTASSLPARLTLHEARIVPLSLPPPRAPRQGVGLHISGLARADALGAVKVACGDLWGMAALPSPMPGNPYDPNEFRLDLTVTAPDGKTRSIPGFWAEPLASRDRGDREDMVGIGEGGFRLRYRPTTPGIHALRLVGRWAGGGSVACRLPDLRVEGAAVDPFVRIAEDDPRFFAIAGRWWWPVGINLHSTYDLLSRDAHGTRLTPERGSLVYRDLIPRFAAAGADACEIWMSSWNLGLEWRADHPGYRGMLRYNQANAQRLDSVLDDAWRNGMRVNLVITNHGIASTDEDAQWQDNPWNSRLGGPFGSAQDWFTSPLALEAQARQRRYIIGRWADHPAILGWKLWTEVNLTASSRPVQQAWHEQAAAAWHAEDGYRHPITTHWCCTYHDVDPVIAAQRGIDYISLDAYRCAQGDAWPSLAELLAQSAVDHQRGLGRFGKPILVTEYGGDPKRAPEWLLDADLRCAAWAGLMSGHAGSPMCWWWEWIDQSGRFLPYRAIRSFIAGEDLRGRGAMPTVLAAQQGAQRLWCRAWARQGRLLFYLHDMRWSCHGTDTGRLADATVVIGENVPAGAMTCEWWDADRGGVILRQRLDHPGGRLMLTIPPFTCHVAGKLWRASPTGETAAIRRGSAAL